jgi:outer membrane protein assembly factor BamB
MHVQRTRHRKMGALGLALLAALGLACATPAHAENWPQWRGPRYDGVSGETGLPTKWSETENIAWKLPLPDKAGATPAVWGDRIFLTTPDGKDQFVWCVSTSGQPLWKTKVADGAHNLAEGNTASPSPSTDGKHVWAFFGTGDLVCLDIDGKIVWKTNIEDRYGKFKLGYGMHMTPVLFGDRLYLQLIHSGGAWVIALNKETGEQVWKVERKSDGRDECEHSYASPTIWAPLPATPAGGGNKDGRDAYLVTHGNDYAIGHSLADGHELWRVGDLNPKDHYNNTLRFVASPVASPDLIVIPSAKNHGVVGLKPDAKGYIGAGQNEYQQWRTDKNTPDVPSPLVQDGLVYLCRESGVLLCLDAKTGQELYSERVHGFRHRASPVWADGYVYLTAADGTVSVVKAGRKYELVAKNKIDDQTLASPAVSGGRIYLRGFGALYAVGK